MIGNTLPSVIVITDPSIGQPKHWTTAIMAIGNELRRQVLLTEETG
jgi:hypothetical protein